MMLGLAALTEQDDVQCARRLASACGQCPEVDMSIDEISHPRKSIILYPPVGWLAKGPQTERTVPRFPLGSITAGLIRRWLQVVSVVAICAMKQ